WTSTAGTAPSRSRPCPATATRRPRAPPSTRCSRCRCAGRVRRAPGAPRRAVQACRARRRAVPGARPADASGRTGSGVGALTGKVAIVTGAGSARGQGAAVARLFAREGARVVVTDLPHTAGAEVAAELGGQGWFQELDVTDQRAWADVVAATRQRWERIDI